MTAGVFADVHGNLPALEAVIQDGETLGVNRWYCLGDMAFKGPAPGECLSLIRRVCGEKALMGNTEHWLPTGPPAHEAKSEQHRVALERWWEWTIQRIDPEEIEWTKRLPAHLDFEIDGVRGRFVHATMRDLEQILLPTAADKAYEEAMDTHLYSLVGCAHIHVPYLRKVLATTVFNVGSVGRPLDRDPRASYVVLRPGSVTFRRIEYDIAQSVGLARERGFPQAEDYERALKNGENF